MPYSLNSIRLRKLGTVFKGKGLTEGQQIAYVLTHGEVRREWNGRVRQYNFKHQLLLGNIGQLIMRFNMLSEYKMGLNK